MDPYLDLPKAGIFGTVHSVDVTESGKGLDGRPCTRTMGLSSRAETKSFPTDFLGCLLVRVWIFCLEVSYFTK